MFVFCFWLCAKPHCPALFSPEFLTLNQLVKSPVTGFLSCRS